MSELGLPGNLLVFASAAAAVWVAGTRLTHYVDAIAERKGLDQAFMGFLVLATATQLPEIVTNSTAALRDDPQLVVNSMFGGIAMQTAVLALADLAVRRHALTFLAESPANLLQGTALILLLSLVLAVSLIGDVALAPACGLWSAILAALYTGLVLLLWRFQRAQPWRPTQVAGAVEADGPQTAGRSATTTATRPDRLQRLSVSALASRAALAALVILLAGVVLVRSAESVATQSGLGASFIGVTLLASATSLPEVSTTLAAVRLGRHSMAVADILGSNLIMVALLLPSDVLYRGGLLLDAVDPSARFALTLGIVVTAIYLFGLVLRLPRRWLGLGFDSWTVLTCYLGGLVVLYQLR